MAETTHHLRVTLLRVTPTVTRDLLVPSDLHLDQLHQVLQAAIGWEDTHLHEFIVGTQREGVRYGPANPDPAFDFRGPATKPETQYTLQQIAPQKDSTFLYWYDFGDDWYHAIVVTAVGAPPPAGAGPRCVAGEGACPPEDCGGPPGYANLLDALSDSKHEQHDDLVDWVGGDFDPLGFDIKAANKQLARLATRWKGSSARKASGK